MKWNQKGILFCVILFVAVVAVMLLQTLESDTEKNEPVYASEEDIISVPEKTDELSGAVSGEAVVTSVPVIEKTGEKKEITPSPVPSVIPKQGKKASEKRQEKDKKGKKEKKERKKKEKQVRTTAEPIKPQVTVISTEEPKKNTVFFEIQCKAIMDKKSLWKDGIEEIIPKSGVFYSGTCPFTEGESVYDILKRICEKKGIVLDSEYTPLYGTYYVKGIGNLYEFDCGSESGWLYSVNGVTPGTGASGYKVKSQDKIVFYYDYEY